MLMEMETRSMPDLSLVREAFLCTTMKGESEIVASVEEMRNRAVKEKIINFIEKI